MIFLGQASNYPARRIMRHLFASGTAEDSRNLRQALAEKYNAPLENVALYHSGRSALSIACQALASPGKPVILPGLTCIAVVRAIKNAGCTPVFVDIDPETLQYDFKKLDQKLQALAASASGTEEGENSVETVSEGAKNAKTIDKNNKVCYNGIIVAQNTLGLPLDMPRLEDLAQKYHFAIVEDLAHCAGRFYADGREMGTAGAATALSFGKGKAVDTVCGGAVVVREPRRDFTLQQPTEQPRLATRLRDRWYPAFGGIVRTLWPLGLGRPLLGLLVRLHWIEKSADTELNTSQSLTHWQAQLAREQLLNLPKTPLRKHYLVKEREQLLNELEQNGYYLRDIWYDTPVSPVRYASEANFPNADCPNTISVACQIINLPTWYPSETLDRARQIIAKYDLTKQSAQSEVEL